MLVRKNRKVNKCIQVLNMFATPCLIVPVAKPRLLIGVAPQDAIHQFLAIWRKQSNTHCSSAQFLLFLFQTSSKCTILALPSRSNWCQLQFKVHLDNVLVFLELIFGEH